MITGNLFIIIMGILFALGLGIQLSNKITDTTIFLLFWFMYILTLITITTVVLSIIFYNTLKKKQGPVGARGEKGDKGPVGDAGLCDINCRNKICSTKIIKFIEDEVNELAGNPDPDIKLKNLYIRERVTQICGSDEFKQFAPYRGANDLIAYLKTTWKTWIELIYKAGGSKYFESIGAENEWEWVKDNPFDEIKKYDIFYWGLGKEYRPRIKSKCTTNPNFIPSKKGEQVGFPDINKDTQFYGKGWKKSNKKDTKYSILAYTNLIPEGFIKHRSSNKIMYIKTVSMNSPNEYLVKNFNPTTEKYDACLSVKDKSLEDKNCNPNNKNQVWLLELTGNTPTEIRLKSVAYNKYLELRPLSQNSETTISKLVSDIPIQSSSSNNKIKDYTLFDIQKI